MARRGAPRARAWQPASTSASPKLPSVAMGSAATDSGRHALVADGAGQYLCGEALSVDRDLIPARLEVVGRGLDDLFELAEKVHYSSLDLGQAVGGPRPRGRRSRCRSASARRSSATEASCVSCFEGLPYPTRAHPGVAEQGVCRAAHRRDDDGHGPIPGSFGGDAGGADELGAAPDRGAPELYDQGSLQQGHAPFSACIEVVQDVVDGLEADGEPDVVVGDAGRLLLVHGELLSGSWRPDE